MLIPLIPITQLLPQLLLSAKKQNDAMKYTEGSQYLEHRDMEKIILY